MTRIFLNFYNTKSNTKLNDRKPKNMRKKKRKNVKDLLIKRKKNPEQGDKKLENCLRIFYATLHAHQIDNKKMIHFSHFTSRKCLILYN